MLGDLEELTMSNSKEVLRVFDHALSWRPVVDLKPYARNARTHSPKQIQKLAASITMVGFNAWVVLEQYDADRLRLPCWGSAF